MLNLTHTTSSRPTLNGVQLRALREAWSMTQTELGALLGVSVATVCRWEGRRKLTDAPELPRWLPYALMGLQATKEPR